MVPFHIFVYMVICVPQTPNFRGLITCPYVLSMPYVPVPLEIIVLEPPLVSTKIYLLVL